MKKAVKLAAGLAISVFFLWLSFRKADLSQVVSTLRMARVELLVWSFLVSVAGLAVRSYRWKLLGENYRGVPWKHFFSATAMGLTLNTFLPFRSGDFFQSFFISRKSRLPQSYTLSTVLLERMADVLPPSVMLLTGSMFVVLPSQIRPGRIAVLLLAVVLAIFLALYLRKPLMSFAERLLGRRMGERARRLVENIAKAMVFLKSRQVAAFALPLTFFNWIVLSNLSVYLIVKSLDIPISFLGMYLVLSITVMSVAIPSSPGFVGTWEFFCMTALSIFGIDRDTALSYAILSHFMAFLPTVLVGLFYFGKEMLFSRPRVSTGEPA